MRVGIGHFSLICRFSFLSPSLWETARYRLKYCLKGPLSPKQPTNQLKGPLNPNQSIVVGCLGLNGLLRHYFSPYRAVYQRGERIDESKNVQTTPPAPTASAVGPCPTEIQTVGRPGTRSRTTRPPQNEYGYRELIVRYFFSRCLV